MGRHVNSDLSIDWKICLPATLAGRVEHLLMNPITGKPKYGARSKLIEELLSGWVREQGVYPDV
jgi:hypothetical protein